MSKRGSDERSEHSVPSNRTPCISIVSAFPGLTIAVLRLFASALLLGVCFSIRSPGVRRSAQRKCAKWNVFFSVRSWDGRIKWMLSVKMGSRVHRCTPHNVSHFPLVDNIPNKIKCTAFPNVFRLVLTVCEQENKKEKGRTLLKRNAFRSE